MSIFRLLLLIAIAYSTGVGDDVCSPNFRYTFSATSTTYNYSQSDSISGNGNTDKFYFNTTTAGRLDISITGNVAFSGSQNSATCPTSSGGVTNATYSFMFPGDVNLMVYNTRNGKQTYTISATFTPIIPRAEYRMDRCHWNSTDTFTDQGGTYTGTANSLLVNSGKVCQGGDFSTDGNTDYVNLPSSLLSGVSDLTLSFWIKASSTGGRQQIIDGVRATPLNLLNPFVDEFGVYLNSNNQLGVSVKDTSQTFSLNTNELTNSTWDHIALTRSGSNVCLYINGSQKSCKTYPTGSLNIDSNQLVLGQRYSYSSLLILFSHLYFDKTYDYQGIMDEMTVFNSAFTASQIQSLYTNQANRYNWDGSPRSCSVCSPISDYRFDECSWSGTSADVLDSSGNGYNGTAFNNLTTVSGGKICRGTTLNGTSQYVTIPAAAANILRDTSSLSFWLNTTQVGNNTNWLAPGIIGIEQSGGQNDIFWGWIDNSGKIGFNAKGDGTQAKSTIAINDGTWRHFVLTRDASSGELQIYINGNLNATGTGGTGTIGNAFSTLGRIEDTGGSPKYLMGSLDEVKIFNYILSPSDISTIYTNEASGYNYNSSTLRTCTFCGTSECTTFQYDLYHRIDPAMSPSNRLHTRIANIAFDVNATVACTNAGDIPSRKITKIYAVNGATCPATSTGLPILWSGSIDINQTNPMITIPSLNSTKAYSNIKLMVETNASELNCSSDTMSIRPSGYSFSASTIKAGESVTMSAQNGGGNYNGITSITTALQSPNSNCTTQNTFLSAIEPYSLVFATDVNSSTLTARDIGSINVFAKDNTWTQTDQTGTTWDCIANSNTTALDSYGLGRLGCDVNATLSLTINPYELKTTLNSFKTPLSTPFNWLYLDSSRTQNIEINTTIEALSKDSVTVTKNFSDNCAGGTVPQGYYFTAAGTYPSDVNVSLRASTGSTSAIADTNRSYVTLFNTQYFSITNSSFKNGDANLSLKFNFLRSPSLPYNPFILTLKDIKTSYNGGVIDLNASGLDKNATFIYGRVRAYDITTNEASAPNPIEFEVYSTVTTGYVSGMPQNILHWYRNLNHDSAEVGNIIQGGFIAGGNDIDVSSLPIDGLQKVTVTSAHDQTVHLDIPQWLWYSSKYNYSYALGSECSQHPCFNYDYTDISGGLKGVNSGTFEGSDFNMTPAKNITNKGVKLFR
ncbi:LamG domain-containing protein [Sulfuricurvum sp.]|uniref:LamG domain-containing protein n=1 Tax=Sulfuricurvum sp. TaxID=2025608 RepID=UPI00260DF056|nr:LamG domain-containing protein [Sulfuricurvum sp.]MDD2265923.1 LamG domain-containing protein [Sulfuricurvum sp.]MDD2782921.1 LamG domain-containing protein [Sulfuricurvum sp.]